VGSPRPDVFSFGVVLLEILSGLSPHADVDLMEQVRPWPLLSLCLAGAVLC